MKTRKIFLVRTFDFLPKDRAEDYKCPECGHETTWLYVLTNSRKEALKKVRQDGVCAHCFLDEIVGWEVILPKEPVIKVGKFRVIVDGSIKEGWIDIVAQDPETGKEAHINNLNYVKEAGGDKPCSTQEQ